MRKRNTLFALICLCLFAFSLTSCKGKEKPSTDSQNYSEEESSWSDENVDENGWT